MSSWLINGSPGDVLPIDDRGLQYGDGVFETIAVRHGKPRFLDRHFSRLRNGCSALNFVCPDIGAIEREVRQVAEGCEFGAAKIIVTRGSGPRGYAPPANANPTRIVGIAPATPPPRSCYDEGIVARMCQTRISANTVAAGMKTLGRTEQVLARAEWQDPQIREGLMCDTEGHVISGTMSNLFLVSEGALHTPDTTRSGVSGIMRQVVMEQAEQAGIQSIRRPIDAAEFADADELFVTNAMIGLWPLRKLVDEKGAVVWTRRVPERGTITHMLKLRLAQLGVTECVG